MTDAFKAFHAEIMRVFWLAKADLPYVHTLYCKQRMETEHKCTCNECVDVPTRAFDEDGTVIIISGPES